MTYGPLSNLAGALLLASEAMKLWGLATARVILYLYVYAPTVDLVYFLSGFMYYVNEGICVI